MKKAIYKPTQENTAIIKELDNYVEILLNGQFITVDKNDVELSEPSPVSGLVNTLHENIYINLLYKPIRNFLFSYNSNRLIPENHQYKPLIKYLNSEQNSILIADEVGLGKTIEAGMIFKEVDSREELKISIIVVPSSLTYKWKNEFDIRFDEYFEIYKTNQFLNFIDEYDNFHSSKLINEKIIISYHTLRDERVIKKLENSFLEVDFLIADEAHSARNSDTSTFHSLAHIANISDHKIFLTATPIQNKLEDLFNILSILDNEYFLEFEFFKKMIQPNGNIHRLISLIRRDYDINEIKNFLQNINSTIAYPKLQNIHNKILNIEELNDEKRIEIIDELTRADHLHFILNRTKKKDIGKIIPRSAVSAIVNITPEEQAFYDAVIEFVMFINPWAPPGFITIMPERIASSSMIASLEKFKEIRGKGKLFINDFEELDDYYEDIDIQDEAQKYLDNIITKGEQIGETDSKFDKFIETVRDIQKRINRQMIVFSFFKTTLNYLEKKLTELGYSAGKIHGDYSIEERYSAIRLFQKGYYDILLSSEVGSEGLDMQFCNVIVNYDLPWNPMRVEQRIGRIDRIGQKNDKLFIFNLCIAGSIEDRIYIKLYNKLSIFEQSLGEVEPILGDLEKNFNITELTKLSQEEIDEKIHFIELSAKRREKESSEHNRELDKLLIDDYVNEIEKNKLLDSRKIKLIQQTTRNLFLQYLKSHYIKYVSLDNSRVKLTKDGTSKLFQLLKAKMSNKRSQPANYKDERLILQRIHKMNQLTVSFDTNYNEDYNYVYLYLNSPIIRLIMKNEKYNLSKVHLNNPDENTAFAVVYRVDFTHFKTISNLYSMLLDSEYNLIRNVDYFDFIDKCADKGDLTEAEYNFEKLKDEAYNQLSEVIERLKTKERNNVKDLLNTKIESISNYYDKQIKKAEQQKNKVSQSDVQRMRVAEIENLKKKRQTKINELEEKKQLNSSFEILGLVKLN